MNQNNTEKLYTLKEACELLSISTATGRNWIKSGRLVPVARPDNKPVFTKTALFSLRDALSSGTLSGLKSRRNKSYISEASLCRSYISKTSANQEALNKLLETLSEENILLNDTTLLCLLRDCAEKLMLSSGLTMSDCYTTLLDDLIPAKEFLSCKEMFPFFREVFYTYIPDEDTLGFLYMSLCSLKDRKSSGSYYTPAWLAKRLVETHLSVLPAAQTILDPSCGTGVFLLQLPKHLPLSHLFGSDLNPVSVALTRINLAIKYRISSLEEAECLKHHIVVSDFLQRKSETEKLPTSFTNNSFDIILGNPPWGARVSAKEKENYRRHFSCAIGNSLETFELFIEQSLNLLSEKGILSFVLPESVLTVKSHTPIRQLLLDKTSVLSVEYLGEVFDQVHCPSIILTVTTNTRQPFFKNVTVYTKEETFSTKADRLYAADFFQFHLTDEEYAILQKISNCSDHTTLVENSIFALGIVTGNNTARLSKTPAPGLEPVIKGTDISKYHINSHSGYLAFQPELFQQVAPESLYRAPEKLFYRFINKQLIFAYDNTGLLSLNSCNILIPQIKGLSIKYVLAVLNSSVAQFFFEKTFRSVKVLRSHLEQIPIPLADKETQEEIVALAEQLMHLPENTAQYKEIYSLLDRKIADLFGLTAEEYERISF